MPPSTVGEPNTRGEKSAVHPVKVRPLSPGQLALCCATLILGVFSFASDTYTYLKVLIDALLTINVALCVLCIRELLETKALGKTLLTASCLVFFWLDAASLAHGPSAFAAPADLPAFTDGFDGRDLQRAIFSVSLFQMLLMVGYSLRLRLPTIANSFRQRVDSRRLGSRLLIYAFAACALINTGMAYGFSIQNIWMALIASRNASSSEWESLGIWNNIFILGMCGSSRLLLDGLISTQGRRAWQVAVGLVACSPFILGGTRHLVLFVMLPVLAAGIIRMKKMSFARAAGLCTAAVLVFAILQLEFAVRSRGWDDISDKVHTEDFIANSNGQFVAALFALHLVPAEHEFFHELAEPFFLIHWIPRAIWPGKPIMAAWAFYDDAYTRGGTFNVTPSVVGQFYMNWNFVGVAYIGLWLGILARFADLLISAIDVNRQRSVVVMAGMLHAFVICSFRYYHPLYFTYFAFSVVLAVMTTRRSDKSSIGRYHSSLNASAIPLVSAHS
jgi:hypothetical protein